MYGSSAGTGGGDPGFAPAGGFQARSRARGRHEAQAERYVEGDLFGSSKRNNFRSSDPPPGQQQHTQYYDRGASGLGNASLAGGYRQQSAVRPSPFARGASDQNDNVSGMGAPSIVAHQAGHDPGGEPASHYPAYPPSRGWSSVAASSEVALVPIDAAGSRGGDAMDEDDDLPTRSLVDTDPADVAGQLAGGIRQRRGGESQEAARNGGRFGSRIDPDAKRDTWVVVWGVPPGKSNDVLSCFSQFGHVEEQRGVPDSNWLYLKYATRLQAEKALAAGHGSRLTNTVMLGVQKVVEDEVWYSLREGRIPPLAAAQPLLGTGSSTSARPSTAQRSGRDEQTVDDADLLGAPPQRPRGEASICGRIKQFFGFYQ